jgi:hypothetical protein
MAAMQRNHFPATLFVIAFGAFFVAPPAHAQVVQLPTFRFFGLSTTVSVPDRGSASLGGVSRSATSRSEHGLPILSRVPVAGRTFGNRAIAGRTETSGASVSAYIHDFETMEEERLGQAAAGPRRSLPAKQARAGGANFAARSTAPIPRSLPVVERPDAAGRTSIAELRRQQQLQNTAAQTAASATTQKDIERARELAASGNAGLAKVYLKRAAKQADPKLRSEISAMFHTLNAPTGGSQVLATPPGSLATRAR